MSFGLPEQHLLPDAVVAFVDGEMPRTVVDRVTAHLARCPWCAADISAQRQARAAVRAADTPSMPAGLLASLRAIPQEVDLPATPDGLAVSADGQLVAVQRPDRAGFGTSAPLGSSPKLGEGRNVLGRRPVRRAAQGAGVVVSGLVLGALAFVNTGTDPSEPATGADVEPVGFVGSEPIQSLIATFGTAAAR
ncbi:MAG TPA: zf-HC2 domain-containing protein [Actinokineospora sp.]|nr:zf-HC2 domain-containing protein [Actinokineospora sp.]